jgi:hypothetical protein
LVSSLGSERENQSELDRVAEAAAERGNSGDDGWVEFIIAAADGDLTKYEALSFTPMDRILIKMKMQKQRKDG